MINPGATKKQRRFRKWINVLAIVYLLLLLLLTLFAEWLPLGFSPSQTNAITGLQSPFNWQLYEPGKAFHWLGTDEIGRDFLAIMVYGTRTALLVSVPAMILATIVGLSLGIIAGYYGDSGFKCSVGKLLSFVSFFFLFLFYAFSTPLNLITPIIPNQPFYLHVVITGILGLGLYKLLTFILIQLPFFRRRISLPLDLLILKIIEIIGAVPRLLLILCLAAFLPSSVTIVVLLSMFTFWPGIARLARAEILKQKNLPYIEATIALGFTPARVLLRHALPNMLVPIVVAITFGICNLIALESTLSFLGVGVPVDTPSWGRAINSFRVYPQAWWLLLFPGLSIILVVLAVQNVNSYIIKQLNPNHAH